MPIPDIVDGNPQIDTQWWMKAAQASIRRYCGWHVTPDIDETLKVDAYGGSILTLPSKHVNSITSILVDGRELVDQIDWSVAGTIQLRTGCWLDRPGSVTVTLNHGYSRDEVPEIAELLRTLAKRRAPSPAWPASPSTAHRSATSPTGAPPSACSYCRSNRQCSTHTD